MPGPMPLCGIMRNNNEIGIITIVQGPTSDAALTSTTAAYAGNVRAGNMLVACWGTQTAGTTPTISDTLGNTWNLAVQNTTGESTGIWWTISKSSGANTVTFGTAGGITIFEVSGITQVDQTASTGHAGSGSTSWGDTSTFTNTYQDGFNVAVVICASGSTISTGTAGWTFSTPVAGYGFEYLSSNSGLSVTASGTISPKAVNSSSAASFHP